MATLALGPQRPHVFIQFHNWSGEAGNGKRASGLQRVLFPEDLERPPSGPYITHNNAPRLSDLVPGVAVSATPSFQCGSCKTLMEEPATLGCQHSFCRSCILSSLGVRSQSDCPAEGCGKKYFRHHLYKPSPVQQEIDALLRRCIQGVSWDCSRRCYEHVPDRCSFIGSKQAVEDHQKECYLRPVGLVLMEGGEELAVPYKDLPSVVRQRVLAQAKEGTDISIRAGPFSAPNRRLSAAFSARLQMTPGRAIPGDREAAAGSRDCQSGVLPRGDVEDKIRKLESDKRELKTFLERETRTSKSLAGDLQQAGALHVAALAKGARVHKQKERAWGVEKEELLAKLETQADKLSSAEERLRQARLESPLAEEVRRLQETVARRGTELRDRRSEWNAEKEGLETELADARADVERIRNDRGSAQKELERVRRSQERERRDQDRVRRELERAERDIERLRSALEHERADLEQERAERTELRERLREEWSEVLGLEEVQAELSEEIEVVRQRDEQIGQLQAELDGEIEVVRQRNEQIRHLEAELNDEIEIVRQRDEQIDQLEEELNDEIEVVRQRDEQVVQLEEELNNETEVVRLRDERIDQLEAAHETSLVEERGQEIAELKAALRGKERERDGLRVTLGKAKELCERVHSLEGRLKRGQCAQGEAWACVVQEAKGLFSKGPEAGDEDLRRKRRRH